MKWIPHFNHLKEGGHLILTTPGGTLDPPDAFYGHIQHFNLEQLASILSESGFRVNLARSWGFPLFSLQKIITKRYFRSVRTNYMEGHLSKKEENYLFGRILCLFRPRPDKPWAANLSQGRQTGAER